MRTHITPADATQALIAALKNRSDEVRNPCAKALGKFRLPGYRTTDGAFISSVEVLKDLFQEPANSPQLRANALRAIGQINPVEARDLASQALDRNSGEPLAIRAIASDVIGKSDASSEELLPIFMQHRPPHNPVPQQ
jgi:HEAT repeat protein